MEHVFSPTVAPILLAIVVVGAFLGTAISYVFKLFFWNESRVRTTIEVAFQSPAFSRAVEQISAAVSRGLAAEIKEIRERQGEQAKSIVSAHRRIDALLERLAMPRKEPTE